MKLLSINLHPFCFYGLMLGVFWYGLQRKGSTFQVVRGRVLKDENCIYGLGFGNKLYGLGRWLTPLPVEKLYNGLFTVREPRTKYSPEQVKDALAKITMKKNPPLLFALQRMTDERSVLDFIKFDCTRELSNELLKEAEDFIEGRLQFPSRAPIQQELLNTRHLTQSKAIASESTKKTRANMSARLEDWRKQRYPKTDLDDDRYVTPAEINVQPELIQPEQLSLKLDGFGTVCKADLNQQASSMGIAAHGFYVANDKTIVDGIVCRNVTRAELDALATDLDVKLKS